MAIFSLILYTVIFSFLLHSILTLFFRKRYPLPLPPGPKPWPIIGNLVHMGPKPHQSIAAMARTYGPLMHLKMGFVDVVVAASASVAAQFLKTHDANFSSRPQNSCTKHLAYNSQDLVFAPYGPRWRMLRKICSVHLFSAKPLDDFRHVRQVLISILHLEVGVFKPNRKKRTKPKIQTKPIKKSEVWFDLVWYWIKI
uniref:Flavonoid 3'-monooxygenase-like n=1 Tax=Nicotiana tabacum TaxID=4097 RepID=A0A1S4DGH9_TOBAC|nr:PREDICTED: flavonoid 3'-monooxygenase-like [Nicotiana tabacum]